MNKILYKAMVLFEAKRIRFAEDANFLIFILKKLPKIGERYTDEWFGNAKDKDKIKYGIVISICRFLAEFIKKIIYVCIFAYIPYIIIGKWCPNIHYNQEKSVMYFFIVMTSICGSITNHTQFTMTDRDYLMLKVMCVRIDMYYIERIISKVMVEIICFPVILWLFGIRPIYAFTIALFTVAMRIAGEMINLIAHDNLKTAYAKRDTVNGLVMAAAFIFAYVLPYVDRNITKAWYVVADPVFIIVEIFCTAGAMYYLCSYKKYGEILKEAAYLRRKD